MRIRSPRMAPPGVGAGGIDGDDSNADVFFAIASRQLVDQCTLAGSRRAGHADAQAVAGMGETAGENLSRRGRPIFYERNGPCQRASVSAARAIDQSSDFRSPGGWFRVSLHSSDDISSIAGPALKRFALLLCSPLPRAPNIAGLRGKAALALLLCSTLPRALEQGFTRARPGRALLGSPNSPCAISFQYCRARAKALRPLAMLAPSQGSLRNSPFS